MLLAGLGTDRHLSQRVCMFNVDCHVPRGHPGRTACVQHFPERSCYSQTLPAHAVFMLT